MVRDDQIEGLGDELVRHELISREDLSKAQAHEDETGTPWYRQLIQMKKLNISAMEDVLKYEFHPKAMRKEHQTLGNTLVELGAISEKQLKQALVLQKKSGRLLGSVLMECGFVTRQTIATSLSKQYGMEYSELSQTPSEIEALDTVPESMAKKYQMIPVSLDGDRLTVLISSPQSRALLKDVGVLLGKRMHPILTTADNIKAEIAKRYNERKASPSSARTVQKIKTKSARPKKKQISKAKETKKVANVEEVEEEYEYVDVEEEISESRFDEIVQEASGAPVLKLVNTIIEGAINSGATDVHMDPQEPEMRIRYRIDGILHDVMSIPDDIQAAVVSRIKIMSDMDITETRHPQDGHFSMEIEDNGYDIRVASLPTFLGERCVLRILDQSSVMAGIKDLGLSKDDEKVLKVAINQPYGMILVTGPTGSGKTTTLYAALNQKNIITDSIVTLEDPVEYQLSGINQVQIDPDIDLTFASTLRAALRQDIDVLLVGEIRDAETARIAIRAAMTGHLVFSTLHTNDAVEAISTLRNMGVPSFLIASALTAVVAQRLVRNICPECKASYTPQKGFAKSLGLPDSIKKLYKGKGCEDCYHTGTKGRTGIFELFEITPNIRKMIADDESIAKIVKAAKLKTMAERCKQKVKDGTVPAEELLRVIRV